MATTLDDITVDYTFANHPNQTGAFRGRVNDSGREDTATFLVDFGDLNTFIDQVKGKSVSYGSGTSATITRNIPLQCPWNTNLYAVALDYQSLGSDNAISNTRPWAEVAVTVTFGTLKWFPNDPSQPYIVKRYRGAGRIITIPGTFYTFSGGERREQDIGKKVGGHIIEITRLQIPNFDAFLALAEPKEGSINSDVVTIGATSYAAGYLLFETFSADDQNNGLGARQSQATIVFHYSSLPWNYDITSAGAVEELSPSIYSATTLSSLLT